MEVPDEISTTPERDISAARLLRSCALMRLIHDLHWMPTFPDGSVATVGEFDGVHRGHRVVLLETARSAVVEGCPSVVVTFDRYQPEQAASLTPDAQRLTTMAQKLELFEAMAIDTVVVLPAERIVPGPADGERDEAIYWIVDEVFTTRLSARVVVVGEDFHFGSRRRLTVETFRARSASAEFRVEQIPLDSRKTAMGEIVSARTIRAALSEGDVATAKRMLGRPYEIRSVVATGERRGRTIGFPTANLPTEARTQVPADGVYACWYTRPDGSQLKAAVNVGKRPTFHPDNDASLIEAHVLDFSGDLYAEPARLSFLERIRSELKFDGIEALKRQLALDIEDVSHRLDTV